MIRILKSIIKRNQDSYDKFIKANRQELADKEKKEMTLIAKYLPEVLTEHETENIVREVIQNLQISSMKEMGKAMSSIKNNHGDNIDMSVVSALIKKLLN